MTKVCVSPGRLDGSTVVSMIVSPLGIFCSTTGVSTPADSQWYLMVVALSAVILAWILTGVSQETVPVVGSTKLTLLILPSLPPATVIAAISATTATAAIARIGTYRGLRRGEGW